MGWTAHRLASLLSDALCHAHRGDAARLGTHYRDVRARSRGLLEDELGYLSRLAAACVALQYRYLVGPHRLKHGLAKVGDGQFGAVGSKGAEGDLELRHGARAVATVLVALEGTRCRLGCLLRCALPGRWSLTGNLLPVVVARGPRERR
jgi:hypothetical protein